jgi:simple sugar transport system ATP-binding protein
VSAELDEVLNLADRVGVIYRGSLVGTFDRSEVTRDQIGLYMASGRETVGTSA